VVNLGDGTVEGHDVETVIGGVEDQVLAHDGQANKAEITSGDIVSFLRREGEVCERCGAADVNAGKTPAVDVTRQLWSGEILGDRDSG
jgi:hypothetical protein